MLRKRIVSGLLALVLLLGNVPMAVLAEEMPLEAPVVLTEEVVETSVPETTIAQTSPPETTAPTQVLEIPELETTAAAEEILVPVVLCDHGKEMAVCNLCSGIQLTADDGTTVTRAEWLRQLTVTFEMAVEDGGNYPDNYFSDLPSDSAYYYDVLLAVEFGVVDIPAGGAVRPEDPTTREFAAQTLNYCLGFQFEGTSYTFSDAALCTYPDDAQIAVDREWFALMDGAFCPEASITTAEMEIMLADAAAVLDSETIDYTAQSVYVFRDDVVVFPYGTDLDIDDNGTITIYNADVMLNPGDTFVVYPTQLPVLYDAVTVSGDTYMMVVTTVAADEATYVDTVSAQGQVALDLSNFEAADGATAIAVSDEAEAAAVAAEYDIEVGADSIVIDRPLDLGENIEASITCTLSNLKLNYKLDTVNQEYYISLSGNSEITSKAEIDIIGALGADNVITLGSVRFQGIGVLTLSVTVALDGSLTLTYTGSFEAGMQRTAAGFRLVKDFHKNAFSCVVEANASIGLRTAIGVDIITAEANIFAETGVSSNLVSTDHGDGDLPYNCTDITAWLYTKVGVYARFGIEPNAKEWEEELDVFDNENSPARVAFHYEDNVMVNKCTRDDDHYVTPEGSSQGSSGYVPGENPENPPSDGNDDTTGSGETITGVEINEVNFPDDVFRAYVSQNIDVGYEIYEEDHFVTYSEHDSILTDREIQACAFIFLPNMGIQSLIGIENFTSMMILNCSFNQLTSLDVNSCDELSILNCSYNQLTDLNVKGCSQLQELQCEGNNLTELNVQGCDILGNLLCGSNQLTSLDVSNNPAIEYIACDNNQLTSLSVGEKVTLENLYCYNNQLTTLDVSGCTALTDLFCNDNQLTSLNASGCTALYKLQCHGNQFTNLNVSGTALTTLYLTDGQLTSLDVSGCTALTGLYCSENQLTSLDVSGCTALTDLRCNDNQLTTLDVSGHTALETLVCSNNPLTTFDASDCTALTSLSFYESQLTSLDVSGCTALTYLDCQENQLTSLDVSGCTALTILWCYDNQLTSLDVSGCTALERLGCNDNQLASLDVSKNTALTYLSCGSNQLTGLDVSKNTALTGLYCYENQLTELDVSKNTALTSLNCSTNQLTGLDVSYNTALTKLYCCENQLTELDVSNNIALTELACSTNQLTSLDVSNNLKLMTFYPHGCKYSIVLNPDGSFDLSTLPGKFDISKSQSWEGGTVEDTILTVDTDAEEVAYGYDCGNNMSAWFTLLITRPEHMHSYTQKTIKDTYRKSAATCTKAAVYYYSCECGEKGTETFSHGQALGHDDQNGVCQRCGHGSKVNPPVVTGSNNASSGKPRLTWKAVDGAVKYQVWRAFSKTGKFSLLYTTKNLYYNHLKAVPGSAYYYKVRAVLSDGTMSGYSNVVTRTCDLARPTGVKIASNAATGKNVISWNAVEGAAKYKVWYSTTGKTGSFKVLMTTKNLTHTHAKAKAGTKYYYKVSAVHSNTAANSALTGYFMRTADLAAPSGVKIGANAAGKNVISWNKVEGAAKYQIWFSKTGKAGSFTLLVTKNASTLTHTHKGGVAGQIYYYKVKAIHINSNANSAYSAVVNRISK